MSAREASAFTATTLQLLWRMDEYESEVDALLEVGMDDATALSRVRLRLDAMRPIAGALPGVSLAWAELLIRHFEVAHTVWQGKSGTLPGGRLAQVREKHAQALKRLRERCVSLVEATDGPGGV